MEGSAVETETPVLTQETLASIMREGKEQGRQVQITLRPGDDGRAGAYLLIQMQLAHLIDVGRYFIHLSTVRVRKRIINEERTGPVTLTDDKLTPELFAEAMLPYLEAATLVS